MDGYIEMQSRINKGHDRNVNADDEADEGNEIYSESNKQRGVFFIPIKGGLNDHGQTPKGYSQGWMGSPKKVSTSSSHSGISIWCLA